MKKTEKKSKSTFFGVISNIFYILALIMLIIGVIHLISFGIQSFDAFEDFAEDGFKNENYYQNDYSEMIMEQIVYFANAVLFMILGSVFGKVNNIIIKKKIEEKYEDVGDNVTGNKDLDEYLTDIDQKVQEQVKQEQAKEIEEKKRIFCAYCGNELDPRDKKCPSCGATKKIIKNNDEI